MYPFGWQGGHVVFLAEMPISSLYLPGGLALAAVAVLMYMFNRLRSGGADFSVVDGLIIAVVVAILGASAVPLVETTSQQARTSSLLQSLQTLRSQIELYKLEHGGAAPVLADGTFPQLIRATNSKGMTGLAGKKYPYGPYLRGGVPVNPVTGRSIVTATDALPPKKPSGNGGWIYDQATAQIAPDVEGYLDR